MIPERFKLVFMSFLAIFICYIDRVNISVAIIPMQEQFGWSEAQTGIIFSIFYIGYVLTMMLGGILADKYGEKAVIHVEHRTLVHTNPVNNGRNQGHIHERPLQR